MGPKGPRSLMAMEYRRGRMCRKFAVYEYSLEPDAAVFGMGLDLPFLAMVGRLWVSIKPEQSSQGDFLEKEKEF